MENERENVIDELVEYKKFLEKVDKATLSEPLNKQVKVHVAIYVRVSTEEQKRDGFSIRSQIEKLTSYACIKDWVIFDIYNDEGISGKNIEERPALLKMIEDIKRGKINAVLVFKLDRLTRSIRDLMELTDIFNENKCEFCSLTENIDTHTASGRMFLKILGIFAEFERENLIERVRGGFERKATEGYSNSKNVFCYGYDRNKGDKVLTVNEEEAKIVQYIFKSFVEEFKTEYRIAKELNVKQIKTKINSFWRPITVKRILGNPTYIGKIRYAMKDKERYTVFDGKHEPIISDEVFQKAQNILNNRQKVVKTKRAKEDAYFTGMLICAKCGGKMVGHRNYKKRKDGVQVSYIQYVCPNHSFNACSQCSINQQKIEIAFVDYISDIEEFTEADKIIPQITNENMENKDLIKDKLNENISKLDAKKHKIMQLFLNDDIKLTEYKEMTELIEKEIALLENSILELEEIEEEENIQINEDDIILNIKDNWLLLNNHEKMEFLQNFVDKIIVESEKEENSRSNKVKVKQIVFNKK